MTLGLGAEGWMAVWRTRIVCDCLYLARCCGHVASSFVLGSRCRCRTSISKTFDTQEESALVNKCLECGEPIEFDVWTPYVCTTARSIVWRHRVDESGMLIEEKN